MAKAKKVAKSVKANDTMKCAKCNREYASNDLREICDLSGWCVKVCTRCIAGV